MITSITLGGLSLDLGQVDVTMGINHGRNDIASPGQAGDASLILRNFPSIPGRIGDPLVIMAYGQVRFTGDVTQLSLSHEYSPSGALLPILQIDAIGRMARLGLSTVGALGYPKQNLEDRVLGIFNATGLAYQANVKTGNELKALGSNDGGYSAMALLSGLCAESGATMCDLPDGTILFESYTSRGVGYNPAHWADLPVADTWADVPYIWSDVYDRTEAAPLTVELPHEAIVWAPIWRNDILTVINEITVLYGNNNSTVESDTASQALYGRRAYALETTLTTLADAQTRAGDIIRAQSEPRYALTNIMIQVDQLDSFTRAEVLDLISGSRVGIPNTPQPSPIEDYEGVVEGWSDHYGPTGYFLTLSLSDPRYSYNVLTWAEVTAGKTFAMVDGTTQWYNVVSNVDLF